MIRQCLAFTLLTVVCATGCSSAQPDDPLSRRIKIPKPRKEPGYGIILLSELVENPGFHLYATMAINSRRFSQLDNDFGRMKKPAEKEKEKENKPADEQPPAEKKKIIEDVSFREVVVEEYSRFFSYYMKELRINTYELRKIARAKDKISKNKKSLKIVPYSEFGRINGEWKITHRPKFKMEYNKEKNELTASVMQTSLDNNISSLSEKTKRGFVINSEVDKTALISYNVKNAPLAAAMLELSKAYEQATGKGLEIEMVDEYTFSVRSGQLLLFSSVGLQNSITVDNVRLFIDTEDKSIFALVTYPGGGETSAYFVYRFPPGKILGLPESMSVFATRRKLNVRNRSNK